MADVFISYSRRDGRFVRRLAGSIERQGKQVWVDTVWDACTACGNATALVAIARTRVTRQLTPLERVTFVAG